MLCRYPESRYDSRFYKPIHAPTDFIFSFKGFSSPQIGLGLRVQGFSYHITIALSFPHMVVTIALTFQGATITIAFTFSLTIVAMMVQLCSHIVIITPLSSPLGIGVYSVFWPFPGHLVFIVFWVFNLPHSCEIFSSYSLSLATS